MDMGMDALLAELRFAYLRIVRSSVRPGRPGQDVTGLVEGPTPETAGTLLRAGVDLAVATEDDQADYGHTTTLVGDTPLRGRTE